MISIPDPKSRMWIQPNLGDSQPTFWASYNIDVCENEGKVRLGKRMIIATNSDDVGTLNVPIGFRSFGSSNKIYTAAGSGGTGYVFKSVVGALDASFAQDAITGTPTNVDSAYSDMEILNGQLFVTTASNAVYYLDSNESAWTSFTPTGSDANKPHMLCTFGGRMYMTYGGNKIISWDSTATPTVATAGAQYTLSLQTDTQTSQITWLRAASDRIWIGTVNKQGGKGNIYSWDGSSTQATTFYRIRASGAMACVVLNDVPYVMDSLGRLLVWNGGTFTEVSRLNLQNKRYLYNPYSTTNLRFIHPNGMSVINGRISLLIDGRAYDGATGNPDTFSQIQTVPSGVYEFDTMGGAPYNIFQNKGLIHKHSLGLAHVGTTISDYGQIRLKSVGALSELVFNDNATSDDGTFLVGASYSDDISSSGGTKFAIWYDNVLDTKQKAGYFITYKVYSPNVTEMWQKLFAQIRDMLTATDKVVVKYRIKEVAFTEVVGKAATTSTITYLGDLTSLVAVGDEIEITQGVNAGICCHATIVSYNGSSTTTITVDETLTSSGSATIKFRYAKWTKGKSIPFGSVNAQEIAIGKASSWIQFKVWMLFTGQDELEQLLIANAPNQKVQ